MKKKNKKKIAHNKTQKKLPHKRITTKQTNNKTKPNRTKKAKATTQGSLNLITMDCKHTGFFIQSRN